MDWQRVIVTGGTGFVGAALCAALRDMGIAPYIVHSSECDLREWPQVEALGGQRGLDADTIIFHLAATVGGIGANRLRPADFYLDNTLINANIVRLATTYECKLVALGSVCAYPKFAPAPFRESSLWHGYPEETNAPYGLSKRNLLVHLQAARWQYGLRSAYLLPTNMYGPGDHFNTASSHVVPALIMRFLQAQAQAAPAVTLWGSGKATRDFLFVADGIRAIIRAADICDEPIPINIGTGRETSIEELAILIRDLVGYRGAIQWDTTKPDGQPRRVLDIGRAWELLEWRPRTELADGLRATITAYLAQEKI